MPAENVTLTAYFEEEAPETFTVTFTVTTNDEAVEGATIAINDENLTTDADGIATIDLENGVYPYSVSASNYEAYSGSITVDGVPVYEDVSLVSVGVNTNLLSNIGVYPNPFQNEIRISNASNASRIVVTSIIGKIVLRIDLSQASSQVVKANLPSGIYLVTIFAKDGSKVVRKMIRE
jgi:hypothetical protein